jgi:hypothetical protein
MGKGLKIVQRTGMITSYKWFQMEQLRKLVQKYLTFSELSGWRMTGTDRAILP